ncbi:MAG: hypothetical protein RIR97_1723, partial [Pseudomonadota bacterium]
MAGFVRHAGKDMADFAFVFPGAIIAFA